MTSDTSPTARALLALELVQGSPGISADRLADKLGVSERAARRYVAILREAGIPMESVRGPYGGYRVGRGLRLPPLVFSSAEALGLVMAVLDGHHDAGDPTDPVGSALGKIVRALPEPVAAQAEVVRRTTAPAPDRAAARPDPATTAALVQACSDHQAVRLDYRSEAGSEWLLEVDPWAVVVRHGRWYLLCRSHRADARRAYRIDRVRSVVVLDHVFTPPADLDPVGSALGKIVRALPEPVAAQAEAVRRTTAPAPDRSAARPRPETTAALVQACSDHRRVRLDYRSEAGSEWLVDVDPWAVVVRHGRWYLLCRSLRSDALRDYRIDRVRDVELLVETFVPPADLDPVALLEQHLAVGWEFDVEVVIDAPADVVARRLPRALGRLEPVDAGACRLLGSTSNPGWYAEQLAAIPAPYRIVECAELRDAARLVGRRLLAAVGE